jgi:hypothetical protein
MFKALLILWTLDPSGAGTASVQEMPSLAACYQFVGRAQFPDATHRACVTADTAGDVAATLRANHCALDAGGLVYSCKGRK